MTARPGAAPRLGRGVAVIITGQGRDDHGRDALIGRVEAGRLLSAKMARARYATALRRLQLATIKAELGAALLWFFMSEQERDRRVAELDEMSCALDVARRLGP
jgi:hypothetical protein